MHIIPALKRSGKRTVVVQGQNGLQNKGLSQEKKKKKRSEIKKRGKRERECGKRQARIRIKNKPN